MWLLSLCLADRNKPVNRQITGVMFSMLQIIPPFSSQNLRNLGINVSHDESISLQVLYYKRALLVKDWLYLFCPRSLETNAQIILGPNKTFSLVVSCSNASSLINNSM